MSSRVPRNLSLLSSALMLYLLLVVLFLPGCGGSNNSTSPTTNATNNPPASAAQPGTSGSGGSSGSGGTSGAAYLYAAVSGNDARILGYKIDSHAASLTEVPGSPFNQQGGAQSGLVAASGSFVYGSEGTVGFTTITAFKADPNTGSLTQIGKPVTTQKNGQDLLLSASSGHNLYEVTNTGDVVTFIINSDGTLTDTGSRLHLGGQINSFAVSPKGQLAYATVINGSPRENLSDALLVLNRDPSSGSLSLNHQVNSNQHLSELQFDSTGGYLLAIGGPTGNQIVVYQVNTSSGDATPVTGSPFTATKVFNDGVRNLRLDPANKFVYILAGNEAQPQTEYVSVFSFSQANGALAHVQTVDMPSENGPASLLVDPSLVFVVSVQSSSVTTNIHVFRRDADTGMLTDSGNTLFTPTPLWESAEVRF
jgi:6-phosphogluconolactonase (cycloisomerase 2 family)